MTEIEPPKQTTVLDSEQKPIGEVYAASLLAASPRSNDLNSISEQLNAPEIAKIVTVLEVIQSDFAKQVLALGKPTVLVLTNGGQIAFDELMDGPAAIIEAFNPSIAGAQALGATIFGTENPSFLWP